MSANDGGDADPVGEPDARLRRDVPEPAAAEVLPELAAADLVDEIEVDQAVAVDIGRGDAVAVIVVDRLVVQPRIVDDVVDEGDPALLDAIGELEVVGDLELIDACRAAPSRAPASASAPTSGFGTWTRTGGALRFRAGRPARGRRARPPRQPGLSAPARRTARVTAADSTSVALRLAGSDRARDS